MSCAARAGEDPRTPEARTSSGLPYALPLRGLRTPRAAVAGGCAAAVKRIARKEHSARRKRSQSALSHRVKRARECVTEGPWASKWCPRSLGLRVRLFTPSARFHLLRYSLERWSLAGRRRQANGRRSASGSIRCSGATGRHGRPRRVVLARSRSDDFRQRPERLGQRQTHLREEHAHARLRTAVSRDITADERAQTAELRDASAETQDDTVERVGE